MRILEVSIIMFVIVNTFIITTIFILINSNILNLLIILTILITTTINNLCATLCHSMGRAQYLFPASVKPHTVKRGFVKLNY